MRKMAFAPALCFVLAGCFGGSGSESSPGPASPARSQCDSYAAQAIQSTDLARATSLAAQASQCYADMQNARRR